jgi:hypothetical protein
MRTKILLGVSLLVLAASAAPAAETTLERRPWEDYEVLVERNLFVRQRGRPPVDDTAPVVRETPPAQRFIRLRGMSRRGDEVTAFLEDARSGETIRIRTGSEVAGGTVTAIGLDTIRYALKGNEVEVAIGENLEASTAAAPVTAETGSAAAAEGGAAADSGGGGSVLERLRRRRMEEVGR